MSKLSIFETRWIKLIFENRNIEYGAYQLSKESPKTTLKSLFLTLFFVLIIVSLPSAIRYLYGIDPRIISFDLPNLGPSIYLQNPAASEKKAFLRPSISKQKTTIAQPN